ncbi:MAG: hypothetical protein ABMA25_13825 [Ilumatobacteraceae bacterium]
MHPTPQQRAAWALARACNGWRSNQICVNSATKAPLATPHPGCLRAQLEHDLLLDDQAPAR